MERSDTTRPDIQPPPDPSSRGSRRIESVDLLRGLVVVVMALDHAREFFTSLTFQPEDLARSFPALFFTRWVTHFCAPAFFFLAGTGAFFYAMNRRQRVALPRFLWTRGAWLILLELTVIDFAMTFSWRFQVGIVFWTLGWSLIVLALLVRARPAVIGAFAAALILLHNSLDGIRPGSSVISQIVGLLHAPFIRPLPGGHVVGMLYPLVPWVGVMAAGYLLGYAYRADTKTRRRWLVVAGTALTAAFVVLRATNLYGDPRPWSQQASVLMTVCSFLNCTKYPPSLCFLLMTLGPSLLFLGLVEGRTSRLARPILTFGRVPLFFFVVHLYVLHILAIAVALVFGQPAGWLTQGAMLIDRPAGYGHGLPFVYAAWAAVVLALYPACRWYADVKRRSSSVFLSYL